MTPKPSQYSDKVVQKVAQILASELVRQDPGALDLSCTDDYTSFMVFETVNLREIAIAILASRCAST